MAIIRSSSKRDYKVVAMQGRDFYKVLWRTRFPGSWREAAWQELKERGSLDFSATTKKAACIEVSRRILLDDPPPWVDVECEQCD